jgi:hypothetical protein
MDGGDISFLLQKQPHLASECDLSKMDGWGISFLLKVQPQLSNLFEIK